MLSTTEDSIREAFTQAAGKDGCVERVKKMRDYAFVHFREREEAQQAMKTMDGAYPWCLTLLKQFSIAEGATAKVRGPKLGEGQTPTLTNGVER